jgi:serine/threonine-protein kinase
MTQLKTESLELYARQHAPLARADVARIVMQIGDALQTAHSAGKVHGDLRPDNVRYDPESQRLELLNFKADARDGASDAQLTRGGFNMTGLLYTAPETLGGESVTPSADQYGLATIAYFLLTGCLPYLAKKPHEILTQLGTQPPIPLNRARSDVQYEPAVEAVVMRGLAKQRQDRYPSVQAFATELRGALLKGA